MACVLSLVFIVAYRVKIIQENVKSKSASPNVTVDSEGAVESDNLDGLDEITSLKSVKSTDSSEYLQSDSSESNSILSTSPSLFYDNALIGLYNEYGHLDLPGFYIDDSNNNTPESIDTQSQSPSQDFEQEEPNENIPKNSSNN